MLDEEKHGTGICKGCPNHTQDCPTNRCVEFVKKHEEMRAKRAYLYALRTNKADQMMAERHQRFDKFYNSRRVLKSMGKLPNQKIGVKK